jgi:hypothetical protein
MYPDMVKGVFGVEDLVWRVPLRFRDKTTEQAGDITTGYAPREAVQKKTGVSIDCRPFEDDPSYKVISGVYYQSLTMFRLLSGEQLLDFIHNPRADVPVPLRQLPCHFEDTKDPNAPERFIQAHDRRPPKKSAST